MSLTEQLLGAVHIFVSETGVSATALGLAAVGDGSVVTRLRQGGSITLKTAQRIYDFMAAERARRAGAEAQEARP